MANNLDHTIHMTNLNIRVSIAILVGRLIALDVLAAFVVLFCYFVIVSGERFLGLALTNPFIFVGGFGILGFIKNLTSLYVILQWLNEYYEITSDSVIHKSGIIFKKKEKYNLENIRAMEIQNNLIGEFFNYGTITLYDMRMQKYLDMYQVHNPNRYVKVLETLRPKIEIKEEDTVLMPSLKQEE